MFINRLSFTAVALFMFWLDFGIMTFRYYKKMNYLKAQVVVGR